jgi:hypothetical protein
MLDHPAVGVLLETCLADKLAFVERTKRRRNGGSPQWESSSTSVNRRVWAADREEGFTINGQEAEK